MVTLKTIKLFSKEKNEIVDWNITVEEDENTKDFAKIHNIEPAKVIKLKSSNEELRFSPSYTDEELQNYADRVNIEELKEKK